MLTGRTVIALVLSFVALAGVLSGCGSESDDGDAGGADKNLTVGFVGDLTGPYAAYDQPYLNAMERAADEWNASPDNGGVKISIASENSRNEQTAAAAGTQKLLGRGVKVFVLPATETNVAQGKLVQAEGGVSSLCCTDSSVLDAVGPSAFFMTYSPDTAVMAAAAQFACDKGWRTAYTLGSDETTYTNPEYFVESFEKICNGKILAEETFRIGSTDFTPQVTRMANADPQPDFIFSGIFIPDAGIFLKDLRSAGVKTPFLGTDGLDTSLLSDAGGKAIDGTYYARDLPFAEPGDPLDEFAKAYKSDTGRPPDGVAAYSARDQIYALGEAAKRAGSVDPKAIRDEVLRFRDVPLLLGERTVDPETRMLTDAELTIVKMDGTQPTFETSVTPEFVPAPLKR